MRITEEQKTRYSKPTRSVVAEDASVKNQYPEAVELTFNTLLINKDHAQAMADHWLALYKVKRNLYRLTAGYDVPLLQTIDLGDVVQVFDSRYGLENGELFNIHGMQYNARAQEVELELWG